MNELSTFDQFAPAIFGLPIAFAAIWFGFTSVEFRRRAWFAVTGFAEDNLTDSFSKKNTERGLAHSYNMKVSDLDGLNYLEEVDERDLYPVAPIEEEVEEIKPRVTEPTSFEFEPEISKGYFEEKYKGTKVDPQKMREKLLH